MMENLRASINRFRGDILGPFELALILWLSISSGFDARAPYQDFLLYVGDALQDFKNHPDFVALHDTEKFLKLTSQLQAVPKIDRGKANELVSNISGQAFTGIPNSSSNNALYRSLGIALSIWTNF